MVKTVCYKQEREWPSRRAAIAYFTEGMMSCDPGSSEYDRYATIVEKLKMGATTATDSMEEDYEY